MSNPQRPAADPRRDAAIDVLIRAWIEDELIPCHSDRCAVAHLIMARTQQEVPHFWYSTVCLGEYADEPHLQEANRILKHLPFTLPELKTIAITFDRHHKNPFDGLTAVCDLLIRLDPEPEPVGDDGSPFDVRDSAESQRCDADRSSAMEVVA